MRTALTAAVAAALVGLTASVGFSAAAGKGAAPGRQVPPVKADQNRNKVADDLETRLALVGDATHVSAIVTLTAPATGERLTGLERAVGNFAVSHRFSLVDGFAATLTKGQVNALARRPEVARVEENSIVRALNDTAQQSFGVTKARTDAPALDGDADGNAAAYTKDDLVAAVIDTGIHAGHADLDEGKVIAFKDFVNGRTDPYDDNGHGTHVAATIAGDGDARADRLHKGVASDAALVGVKVLAADGSGDMASVVAALDWVVANKDVYGIEVVNLSLGASGCGDGTSADAQAVNNANAAGLVVAVAAGNEGPGTCTIGTPGDAAGALTVGAMADFGPLGFKQASFSSRGPTFDGRIKPDVSAPGVAVTSADSTTTNGYVTWSGTSMATPFVAGVALLMRDANPALTPQQVKDAVMTTALDWGRGGDNRTAGTTGRDIDYGAGRLDAYAALKAAGAPLGTGPAGPRRELREGTLSGTGASASYQLNVDNLAFPIAATLIIPGLSAGSAATPDFDLYLYNPSGTLVASSERMDRQEDLGYTPTATGTYTLRVYSYSGSGSYFVDISAGLFVDTVAPTITSVTPADGSTGIAAGTNVTVAFSEAMNVSSAQSAFSLVRSSDGAAVAGAFRWSGNTMTFDATADLAAGTQYTARVTTAAKDAAGNALAAEKTWSFTTAAAVSSVNAFPSSTTIYSGTLRSGGVTQLRSDDNAYYEVNSTTSGTRASDWYGRITTVPNALRSLKVTYRGKASTTCTQAVSIYNWTTGAWIRLDSRSAGTTEAEVAVSATGTLADYVSGSTGNGDVAVRVRCARTDYVNFYASGDLLQITYTT